MGKGMVLQELGMGWTSPRQCKGTPGTGSSPPGCLEVALSACLCTPWMFLWCLALPLPVPTVNALVLLMHPHNATCPQCTPLTHSLHNEPL